MDNSSKPIFFDGIDNSAYVTGKAKHSHGTRPVGLYRRRELLWRSRGRRARPGCARRKDGVESALFFEGYLDAEPTLSMGAVPSIYNLTMDPYEKYDMTFNGAVSNPQPRLRRRVATPARLDVVGPCA